MYTHKQDRTNREEGLESIVESMYSEDCGVSHGKRKKKKVKEQDDPKSEGSLSHTTMPAIMGPKCTHCDGTGQHGNIKCKECNGKGYLPPTPKEPVKEADYVPPHDEDKLKRAKKRGFDKDIDHHNQYMMDQDLLQPIHKAASLATDGEAKNFNEWLILQIKDQGDNWVDWFIETVIVEERFRD